MVASVQINKSINAHPELAQKLHILPAEDITAIDISDQIKELQQAENSRYHRNE